MLHCQTNSLVTQLVYPFELVSITRLVIRQVIHVTSLVTRLVIGLYKIFVYFEAVVHESTIPPCPPPTCIVYPGAILLHDHWTVYDSPSDLPCVCYIPYNIGNNNIV